MENVLNNKVLCLNDEENLPRKKASILSYLSKGVDVFAVFDTETTGTNIYPKDGQPRDRILEVGFVMYYRDSDGEVKPIMLDGKPVGFQEYINPFREDKKTFERAESRPQTDPEAFKVHQISNKFLYGQESFNGVKLFKPAPTFAEVKPYMEDFLCLKEAPELEGTMHFVAHNGQKFDAPMLTEEMYLVDQYNPEVDIKSTFESKIESLIDTMKIMKDLYDKQDLFNHADTTDVKPGYSMSYLAHMLNVKEEGREDFHGAMLDSLILGKVFNEMLKTPEWKKAKNKIKIRTLGQKKGDNKIIPIPEINSSSNGVMNSSEALTIIKTDASKEEGTGTVKEYVEAAKEAGLTSLVMADVVTVSRFVEFYEECKAADIKPIIATTFKVDSEHDIYNFIEKNKKLGALNDIENVFSKTLSTHLDVDFHSLSGFIQDNNISLDDLEKAISPILELNAKKYSPRESSQVSLNKLADKVVKNIVALTDIKYDKKKYDPKEIADNVLSKKTLIKAENFSHAKDHSDLLLVAKDDEGFLTLKKLITQANDEGQYFVKKDKMLGRGENPLITLDMLKENNKSLIALIGNKNDLLGKAVMANDVKRSQLIVRDLKSIFGDNLKAQIGASEQTINRNAENKFLENISKVCSKQGVDAIAVHHASFAKRSDYKTHMNKYAILEDKYVSDVTLDSGVTKEQHIQSVDILREKFSLNGNLINNAFNLINENNLSPTLHKPSLPTFKTGNDNTQAQELEERALKGLRAKLPAAFKKAVVKGKVENNREAYLEFCNNYKDRLDYELGIINEMDFPGYFLIKQQMVDFCKSEGIPVGAGRGSAAGSLVVYSLGITDADPLEHGLIFERFLNPERKEMPDIDTDIDGEHREKVLKFLVDEYQEEGLGYSGAAYIMTKGTFSAKNTIRALAKAEGLSLHWADELAKQISKEPGTKLSGELENNEIIQLRYETEVKTRSIIDQAIELEKNGGRQISLGKHAGGIVVGGLINQAPITKIKGVPVVQADKNDIESLGAVKFDLLGSATLAKLDLALRNVLDNKGVDSLTNIGIHPEGKLFNFDNFSYNDEETYKMLQEGNSTNVFQIESDLFKDLLKRVKPQNLEEIVALVSLGRPGPMQSGMHEMFIENKFDPSQREKFHPLIDDLLDETHGTIIYQEQVMAIAQKLSGFTMGGADKLRKAMGKKKIEEMHKQKSLFVEGAVKNGVEEELAVDIFDTIEKFAGYGFNKSHALAYSLLTYKMAYMRRHYPTETMSAILSLDALGNNASKDLPRAIQSCKDVNIKLFTPNINESDINFRPGKSNGVLYGLSGIKGYTYNKIITEREKNGSFENMEDFIIRCGASKSVEALIDCGAMDSIKLLGTLSTENKAFLKTLSKEEKTIVKRELIKEEFEFLKTPLSSASKIKSYQKGSFNKDLLSSNYNKSLVFFNKNKSMVMSKMLDKENELLGGYITTHPLNVGTVKEDIKKEAKNPLLPLSSFEDMNVFNKNQKFTVMGCVKEASGNLISKAGNKFAAIELNDESMTKTMYLSDELFKDFNNKIKSATGKGIQEGEPLGMEVGFYVQGEELKLSVNSIHSPNNKIIVQKSNQRNQNRNSYS